MTSPYFPPQGPVRLLHVDEALVIACKPPGLLSVPGRGAGKADCLPAHLSGGLGALHIVHRLDMETSGLIVLARTLAAQSQLSRAFAERRVAKTYEALVSGQLAGEAGEIDLPLVADWPKRPRQKVCHETGKPSLTRWRVVSHEAGLSRVELHPETGRTHQLRVHLAALGHPILGDSLYAPSGGAGAPRLMLHATSLSMPHPDGGKVSARSPAPF